MKIGTRNILILLAYAALAAGCASPRTQYEKAVRSAVFSVVHCGNPEILLAGDAVEDVDHQAYFQESGKIAYSFERVELGPGVVGYRADLIPHGQGWSGYRHGRLFELRDGELVLIFELAGPHLFVEEGAPVNGRHRLWHWVGDDPVTAKIQHYTYTNGHYMKNPTMVVQ